MNIRMKTPGVNDGKPFMPGDIIEVSETEGNALVSRGLAEEADPAYKFRSDAIKPLARRGRYPKAGDTDG